jgi:hypothetical protein
MIKWLDLVNQRKRVGSGNLYVIIYYIFIFKLNLFIILKQKKKKRLKRNFQC